MPNRFQTLENQWLGKGLRSLLLSVRSASNPKSKSRRILDSKIKLLFLIGVPDMANLYTTLPNFIEVLDNGTQVGVEPGKGERLIESK